MTKGGGGVSQKMTKDDEGGGVWKPLKSADMICEQPLMYNIFTINDIHIILNMLDFHDHISMCVSNTLQGRVVEFAPGDQSLDRSTLHSVCEKIHLFEGKYICLREQIFVCGKRYLFVGKI